MAEGKSIFFIKFYMNHSSGSYRTMNHIYKISVLSTTCVRICEDLPRAVTGQLQNHTRWNFQPGLLGCLVSFLTILFCIYATYSKLLVQRWHHNWVMQKINQEIIGYKHQLCFIRNRLNNLLQDLLISFTQPVNTLTAATERSLIYSNLSLCRQYFSICFSTVQEHP